MAENNRQHRTQTQLVQNVCPRCDGLEMFPDRSKFCTCAEYCGDLGCTGLRP